MLGAATMLANGAGHAPRSLGTWVELQLCTELDGLRSDASELPRLQRRHRVLVLLACTKARVRSVVADTYRR
jgi:hypothetical protein